jgi:Mg2+ and Co2+ transporter CorA
MNFVDMPELEWQHGYSMFWILSVTMVTGILTIFYHFDLFNQ